MYRVNRKDQEQLSKLHPLPATKHEIAAWILAGVALVLVLRLHLLPSLIGGLLVHELVHLLSPRVARIGSVGRFSAKLVVVSLIATIVILAITGLVMGLVVFFRSESGNLPALLQKMANIIESSRESLPLWLQTYLPEGATAIKQGAVDWLREHSYDLRTLGGDTARGLTHALVGMILGALISLTEVRARFHFGPLAQALVTRLQYMAFAFRRIVFAQVRISALNTSLTAIYLAIVLPLFGVNLPLTKTMIVVTFLVGLMPILGNLISNTVVVVISLSNSLTVAIASLIFLVVIHKLEYFINARIVGSQIHAAAWELLLALLVMEAAFGIPGLIAAPIFYAYVKKELVERGLI
jgi:predicted PurR-regulated permease PerM